MAKQYILQKHDTGTEQVTEGTVTRVEIPTDYLDVEEKRIAYRETHRTINRRELDRNVVIPGIVVSSTYQTETGFDAVDVEPITDEDFKSKVKDALSDKGIKYYSFW